MNKPVKTTFKIVTAIAAIIIVAVVVVIYRDHNPAGSSMFPKCVFFTMTGYKCPGCGTQRALHYLLNGEFRESFRQNPMFHVGMAYVVAYYVSKSPLVYPKYPKIADALSSAAVCIMWLVGIIAYWILRNV